MRSLYVRIFAASLCTVLLSLAAFLGIFFAFTGPSIQRMAHAFEDILTDDAVDVFTRGGAPAVSAYLARLQTTSPMMTRYLVDANGRDVLTGIDRSALLRASSDRRRDQEGRDILVHRSSDGKYSMVIAAVPRLGFRDLTPYFVLILGAVAFVCWLLALGIVSPIREIVATVNKFGQGHLRVRAAIVRRDEIGELTHSFNQMADRIETLVTAERRLLQDVSHELRSPLTRLSMAIELSRTAPDRNAAADRLQREADRLAHLIGTLLEVIRLEGEPAPQTNSLVDVPAVVREVAGDCELEAASRDCRIVVDTVEDTRLSANPELLRRAFENTLRNAIRYAPSGTLVEIRCERQGLDLVVTVRDFGPGVPEETIAHLGNPFYRVDTSRDSSTGGLGLGLAITRRAIQLHHGTLSVENAHPGLRAIITIPRMSPAA